MTIELGKFLAAGQFGAVHYAEDADSKNVFALKRIPRQKVEGGLNGKKNVMREIGILNLVKSPNVVKFYRACLTTDYYNLLMEFCNGGDLGAYIKSRGGYLSE